MNKLSTSGPNTPDGFRDSFSFSDTPQYAAARDLAYALDSAVDVSDARSAAHNAANLFRDLHVSPRENQKTHELRQELAGVQHALGRLALMAMNEAFRTIDLVRVRNYGDWNATNEAEHEISRIASALEHTGEIDGLIPRQSEHAKRHIVFDPTLVAGGGLVLIRRQRLMLATHPIEHRFIDRRPRAGYGVADESSGRVLSADTHLEIDKVSEFILNVNTLSDIDERAAREVDAVVASGGPQRLKSQEYRTSQIIEAAITARHDMLTPVTTTYYADRKYANIRDAQEEQAA